MNKRHIGLMISVPWVLMMMGLDITAPNLMLPQLMSQFSVSMSHVSWVITMYLLFYVGSIIPAGRAGDLYGHRNIAVIGVLLFAVASTLVGFAGSWYVLLVARALQGIAAGLIWPNTSAMVFQSLDEKNRGLGLGLFAGVIGLSLALGPIVAGLFIHAVDWRWVFWLNAPLSLFSLIAMLCMLPNNHERSSERIDLLGAAILTVALAAVTYAVSELSILIAAVGLVAGVVFYKQQGTSSSPIISKALLANADFRFGSMQRVFMAMPFYVILFLFGSMFQTVWHLNAFKAGLYFLPMMMVVAILSPVGGKLVDCLGMKFSSLLAVGFYLLGFVVLLCFGQHLSVMTVSLLLMIPGAAFSIGSPVSMARSLQSLPKVMHGSASGVFYMVSLLSGALAVTLSGLILRHAHSMTAVLCLPLLLSIINGLAVLIASKSRSKDRAQISV